MKRFAKLLAACFFLLCILVYFALPISASLEGLTFSSTTIYTHNHYATAYMEAVSVNETRPATYYSLFENYISATYNLTPIYPATSLYNCHSYAWYERSSSNTVWLDYLYTFPQDATLILDASDLQPGDIVVYVDVNYEGYHSAVIESISSFTEGNVTLLSKWGEYGIYRHSIYNNIYTDPQICEHELAGFAFFRIECKYDRYYTDLGNTSHRATCWCGATQVQPHTSEIVGNAMICTKCGHSVDLWKQEPVGE